MPLICMITQESVVWTSSGLSGQNDTAKGWEQVFLSAREYIDSSSTGTHTIISQRHVYVDYIYFQVIT